MLYKTVSLEGEAVPSFTLTSPAFQEGQTIPAMFTCMGANVSPHLVWQHAPAGTKSLVLIVDDPDAKAVVGKTYVHWIVVNIPAETQQLTQGASLKNAGTIKELVNDGGKTAYTGPCPPDKEHTYYFTIFALNKPVEDAHLTPPFTAATFRMEYSTSILGEAVLTGRYAKP